MPAEEVSIMQKRSTIPPQVIEDYWRLFVNRREYTLQSTRPHPETGRHYYFRPSHKRTGAPLKLNANTIRRHLAGELTIGLYAINPENQCCKWLAIDADYKDAMEDLLKLQFRLGQDGVQPALEMSKRVGHLWIFLAKPLLAKHCRIYIHDVALRLGVPVKGADLREGIEIFPKQDNIGAGEFGNALRGPLGVHRGAARRFWFYGADYTVEAQIAYLNGLRKLKDDELQAFIAGKEGPKQDRASKISVSTFRGHTARSEFRILEHIGPIRRLGRNYVTRCPACAKAGHDQSGDNLAILIEDPRFYRCWAGCPKEAIRAALGFPIRTAESQHVPEIAS
jgi:hypothetical protein